MSEVNELQEGWAAVSLGQVSTKSSTKVNPTDFPDAKFVGMDCIESNSLTVHHTYKFGDFKSSGK